MLIRCEPGISRFVKTVVAEVAQGAPKVANQVTNVSKSWNVDQCLTGVYALRRFF